MTKKYSKDGAESVESSRLGKPLQDLELERLLVHPLVVLRAKRGGTERVLLCPSTNSYYSFNIMKAEPFENTSHVFGAVNEPPLGHLVASEVRRIKRGETITVGNTLYTKLAGAMSRSEFQELERKRTKRQEKLNPKPTETKDADHQAEQGRGAAEAGEEDADPGDVDGVL